MFVLTCTLIRALQLAGLMSSASAHVTLATGACVHPPYPVSRYSHNLPMRRSQGSHHSIQTGGNTRRYTCQYRFYVAYTTSAIKNRRRNTRR